MEQVLNNMNISWICTVCGATNHSMNGVCQECSSKYGTCPEPSPSPGGNQALLNQGVIFNNAVFNQPQPDPSIDDICQTLEDCYGDAIEEEKSGPKEESFGMRVFIWSCNIITWLAILIAGSIFAFFVFIVIKAFTSM